MLLPPKRDIYSPNWEDEFLKDVEIEDSATNVTEKGHAWVDSMAGGNREFTQQKKCIFSFISPSEPNRISYAQQKQRLSHAMQEHPWFKDGILLETMEKGVLYPVVHCVEVPSSRRNASVPLLHSSVLGANFVLQQGVYVEIKEFRPDNDRLLRLSTRPNADRCLMLLAFKTLDSTFSEMLEETWKDWTGARKIYLNLPDELGLSRFAFYRKMSPVEASSFVYILLVQCENVPQSKNLMMLDFIHRFRVLKMMGYISVYKGLKDAPALTVTNHTQQKLFSQSYLNGVLDQFDDKGTKVDI